MVSLTFFTSLIDGLGIACSARDVCAARSGRQLDDIHWSAPSAPRACETSSSFTFVGEECVQSGTSVSFSVPGGRHG